MFKYRHKETGLFLKKRKSAYSSVYSLDEKGTLWQKKVLHTLSLTKDQSIYGYNQYFDPKEFELVEYELKEKV